MFRVVGGKLTVARLILEARRLRPDVDNDRQPKKTVMSSEAVDGVWE